MGEQRFRKCYVINGVAYACTKCRHCFADIVFVPTAAGKRMPTDANGVNHFITCPVLVARRQERRRARRRRTGQDRQGRLFE